MIVDLPLAKEKIVLHLNKKKTIIQIIKAIIRIKKITPIILRKIMEFLLQIMNFTINIYLKNRVIQRQI